MQFWMKKIVDDSFTTYGCVGSAHSPKNPYTTQYVGVKRWGGQGLKSIVSFWRSQNNTFFHQIPQGPRHHNRCVANVRTCASCASTAGESTCGACKVVKYCDKECQLRHWREHKQLCPAHRGIRQAVCSYAQC